MSIAIIPARGGSKRIPRKNIKEFNGKPIMLYSIETAQKSNLFEKIFVSSEDEEILNIALAAGVEVIERPMQLSDDNIGTAPVVRQAIQALEVAPDTQVCCIYATAPLLEVADLLEAKRLLDENPTKQIFAATAFSFPPQRAFMLDKSGLAFYLAPEHKLTRSQDLEKIYHDAGQFYFAQAQIWQKKNIFELPLILPETKVQDIDNLTDWRLAELKHKLLIEQNVPK